MGKKILFNHGRGTLVVPDYNVSKIRLMSDDESEKRAKSDLDAPVINLEFAKKVIGKRNLE
jgi:hypothetical protein